MLIKNEWVLKKCSDIAILEIKELLNIYHSFIREWKNQALFHGVESLKLQYGGKKKVT